MKTWTTVLCAAALLAGWAKKDAGVDAPDAINDPPAGDEAPKTVKAPKVDVMDINIRKRLKEVQKTLKEVKEDYENKKQTIADPLKFPLKTQDEE